jgi:hypothetical protein
MLGSLLNVMIPSWSAEFPDRIGSQEPEMMCHSTGTEVEPNVTAQRAVPRTGIGELLYGFSFAVEGIIRPRRFQRLAWMVPHTETFAPVSAIGLPTELLTMTVARKSHVDFSLGST